MKIKISFDDKNGKGYMITDGDSIEELNQYKMKFIEICRIKNCKSEISKEEQ